MRLRSLMCLGLLLCLSCDALFGAFSQPNPKNCVQNAAICSASEVCDSINERCVPIRPDFDFFSVQTSAHEQEASHVLAGNFDGDDQPDVLLVGGGSSTVLYNVGSTLESRRTFTSSSRPGPFYALASRVNADLLDDLVLITEKGDTSMTYGTIEFCEARGANMKPPFACGSPGDLQFVPKAVAITDILEDPLPELVAVDEKGAIKVCRAVNITGMQGECKDVQAQTANSVSYAQLVLLDDINGDGRPDVGVLTGWQSLAPTLQILRSAGGQLPTLSNSIQLDLGIPVLVAGNFRQNNSPCVAAIGTKANKVTVYPYCDLQQASPTMLSEVVTDSANLRGDPTDVGATAVGQFDGLGGSKPDDIALQMSDNTTVFVLGSASGPVLSSTDPTSFVAQPATHLVAAAFSHGTTARSDVFMYNDPRESGGGLLGLMRSAGQSARGLMARATQIRDTSILTSNQLLLNGSFTGPSNHDLLLLPQTGGPGTLYGRNPTGQFAPVTLNPALALTDSVVAATTVPCDGGPHAVAIAYQNERRPALVQFRQNGAMPSFLDNDTALRQIHAADINADNKTDLLILRSDGSVHAALANGGCTFSTFTLLATLPPPGNSPSSIAVADAIAI